MRTSTSMLCPDLCSGQSRRSLYERSPKLIQDYSTTSPRQHSEVSTLLRTSTGRSTKSFGSCVRSSATLFADTSRLRRTGVRRVECLRFYQGAVGRTILGNTTGFSSTFEPYCESCVEESRMLVHSFVHNCGRLQLAIGLSFHSDGRRCIGFRDSGLMLSFSGEALAMQNA